jgi:hypothetical protein
MAESPAFNISAMIRSGRRGYFLTENCIIPGSESMVMLSMDGRSIIIKVGLDYGLSIPVIENMEEFIAIP